MAESYDKQKTWRGRTYTGMKVGRAHSWEYEGRWKERKIGPDAWDVSFVATKSRKGRGAPDGSGAPVGTEYLWFFAPTVQVARKLDANTYATHMEGLKWKIGFRPATAKTWDFEWEKTGETARQRTIRILQQTLADLKADEREGAPPLDAPALEGERPTPRSGRKRIRRRQRRSARRRRRRPTLARPRVARPRLDRPPARLRHRSRHERLATRRSAVAVHQPPVANKSRARSVTQNSFPSGSSMTIQLQSSPGYGQSVARRPPIDSSLFVSASMSSVSRSMCMRFAPRFVSAVGCSPSRRRRRSVGCSSAA